MLHSSNPEVNVPSERVVLHASSDRKVLNAVSKYSQNWEVTVLDSASWNAMQIEYKALDSWRSWGRRGWSMVSLAVVEWSTLKPLFMTTRYQYTMLQPACLKYFHVSNSHSLKRASSSTTLRETVSCNSRLTSATDQLISNNRIISQTTLTGVPLQFHPPFSLLAKIPLSPPLSRRHRCLDRLISTNKVTARRNPRTPS